MDKITIILNEGPSNIRSWNGLRVAMGSAGANMEVEVFLLDASVYAAKKGQNPPKGLIELNLANKLTELMKLGVKVRACGTCIDQGGLTKDEILEGVIVSNVADLANSIKESKNVLVF